MTGEPIDVQIQIVEVESRSKNEDKKLVPFVHVRKPRELEGHFYQLNPRDTLSPKTAVEEKIYEAQKEWFNSGQSEYINKMNIHLAEPLGTYNTKFSKVGSMEKDVIAISASGEFYVLGNDGQKRLEKSREERNKIKRNFTTKNKLVIYEPNEI